MMLRTRVGREAVSELTLVIGNKNYSSWSLRPWLAMRQADIPFTEKLIPLFGPDWPKPVEGISPTLKVPVLIDGETKVWESLAILEYLTERFPDAGLWPDDAGARAMARTVAAEMHAGFTALRGHMPMNLKKSLPGKGRGEGVDDDVRRVTEIWRQCRETYGAGGPFLFGRFSNADAMFAPVVTRLDTYGVEMDAVSRKYVDTILGLSTFQEWLAAAKAEPWTIDEDEVE